MYARIERFNLSQGFAELAEGLADRVAPIMRRQPGLHAFTLLADETSGEYLFLSHWETIEAVHTYERSPDEWRVRDIMSPHITTVPVLEVYQVHTLSAAPEAIIAAASAPAAAPEPIAVGATEYAATATPTAEAATAAPAATATAASSVDRALAAGVTIAEPVRGQCPADFPVKGNHSGSGDFIYHLPGGQFYDRTTPEVCFADEDAAVRAGFRAPRA